MRKTLCSKPAHSSTLRMCSCVPAYMLGHAEATANKAAITRNSLRLPQKQLQHIQGIATQGQQAATVDPGTKHKQYPLPSATPHHWS